VAGCSCSGQSAGLNSFVTMNLQILINVPVICYGGIAKGQIVREIECIGQDNKLVYVSDKSASNLRMLNISKGPAHVEP